MSNTTIHVVVDPSERLALEEQERERVRAQQYEELRSEFNSTAVRIRAWEKLHGLRLPTSFPHPVLRVISVATGIPIGAIRDEQQARRDAGATRPPVKAEAAPTPSDATLENSGETSA